MRGAKVILTVETIGFFIVMIAVWFNEFFDLPHYLFGIMPMGFNYHEAAFESFFVMVLALIVIVITWRQTKRILQLESLLPICSFCKKIRKPDSDPMKQESWEELELYINEKTGSQFSHGFCPQCAEKHYGKYGRPL